MLNNKKISIIIITIIIIKIKNKLIKINLSITKSLYKKSKKIKLHSKILILVGDNK